MTKFADQLFDDLMREHGPAFARPAVPSAPRRRLTARPVLAAAGVAGLAVAATAGALLAEGGAAPAFAATPHADGTVTLAVYDKSGYAGINASLRKLGDSRVVVVPVVAGCPTSLHSLPAPKVPQKYTVVFVGTNPKTGAVTVRAGRIPVGDILVVAVQISASGGTTTAVSVTTAVSISRLTSPPAPSCVSPLPPPPARSSGGTSGPPETQTGAAPSRSVQGG
jgi:hypothetical protein